ncbi:hypothetical protein DF19_25105 [Streptomyces olindensis]|nr:hypothetical protein DF19_25105 [Streptomyces olindensis]
MALTVGELNAIMSIDDRAVNPALRRAEQAMRQTGQRMGDDAERAGEEAGQQLGEGVRTAFLARIRGALGRFRSAGRQAGEAAGEGIADGAAEGADAAVDQAAGRFDRMKTMAAGAGLAAGAVLTAGFTQALDQSSITARLSAQLGATPAEAQRYGQIAGQLFKEAIVTDFQQGADAVKAIASSGLIPPGATNAQIKSIAANAADLASIMEVDVGMAAQAAGTMVRNGLAKNGKEAFDLLVAGSKGLGAASDDLLETFTEYGPVFKSAGLSGQTAMGLIRQAVQGGWGKDTDKIADAFKELSLQVTSGSTGAADALKSLGLDAKKVGDDMAAGGKRGEAAMGLILDSLRKVGPDTQTAKQAVQTLFGGPGEDLGAALFALDVGKASKAMGGAKNAADDLGKGLRDSAAHQVTAFKNSMQQNLVEFLGTSVIPKLSSFFGFVQQHSGVFKAAAIGVLALGAAFTIASIGVWAMNSAMLANPMFWIIAGIVAGLAGLVLLVVTYWDEIVSATTTAWDWIVSKVVGAKNLILAAIAYLGTIPGKVATWFGQMKDWAIQKLLALVAWVTGLPGRVSSAVSSMASKLSARASAAWQAFQVATAKKVVAFITYVRGLPGKISSGIGSLSDLLVSKGRNVVEGLWSGIKSMGGWIRDKLISWAKDMVPGPIAKALGIASPSKVTKAQGRWIARGLVDGLTGSSKQVKSASGKLADIIADSLRPGRKRSQALAKLGTGTKQLLALAKREEALAAKMKTSTKKLDDLRKAREKLAQDVAKGVLDSANITKQDDSGWPVTAASILAGLQQDTAAAQQFAKNLATLRKKGVRSDLVAQIAQAGVEQGSAAAAALANADASQIKQINAQQKLLVGAADQAGSTAGNAMYSAGIAAGAGLVKGLQKQQRAIEKQMLKIAQGMSKSIRKALGIKSPSRVMARVGAYTAQGLVKGLEGERSAVNSAMASLVDTPAPGNWGAGAGAGHGRERPIRITWEVKAQRPNDEARYLMGRIQRGVRITAGTDDQRAFTGKRSR